MEEEIPKNYLKQMLNEYKGCVVSICTNVIINATDGTEILTCEIVHAGDDYVHVVQYGEDDKKGLNDHSFIPYHAIGRVTLELEDKGE